jgi:hypothetical protein
MRGEQREEWERLCQLAADEQDPHELMVLIRRITQLLDEKEARLKRQQQSETATP